MRIPDAPNPPSGLSEPAVTPSALLDLVAIEPERSPLRQRMGKF
jgi:hypothetical protein